MFFFCSYSGCYGPDNSGNHPRHTVQIVDTTSIANANFLIDYWLRGFIIYRWFKILSMRHIIKVINGLVNRIFSFILCWRIICHLYNHFYISVNFLLNCAGTGRLLRLVRNVIKQVHFFLTLFFVADLLFWELSFFPFLALHHSLYCTCIIE